MDILKQWLNKNYVVLHVISFYFCCLFPINRSHFMKIFKIVYQIVIVFSIIIPKTSSAQTLKACDIATVDAVNVAVNTHLIFDTTSIINKNGKFECRYTDSNAPNTYIAIGLLYSKVQYGYDLLAEDFKSNKQTIFEGKKAVGKFSVFIPIDSAGKNAFYMTGEKDDYSPEAFAFKFRKGDYILSISSHGIPLAKMTAKISEIYTLFDNL